MNYYRKNVNNTTNDLKLKMQIGGLTVKMTENINKINDLLEVDKDIKKDITDNSNSIKNMKNEISDKVDKNYIDNNYYNKNYVDILSSNVYNRTHLDNKFDDIYNKSNNKISKLDRNIVLFNTNLTKFIDETYKQDQKLQDNKISTLENKNLTDVQINKMNQLENIDLGKINTSYNFYNKINDMTYYIKEFFMHNIDLVRRFEITSEMDYIQISQFEIDRKFLVNNIIKFFISIKLLYENMSKVYWVLYFKMDVHYKDDVLIKSFKKQMTSKGFLFKNLATYNIDNMFKLNKDTDRLIFKLYMHKVSTAYKNNIIITLTNSLEENYCNLIWYSNIYLNIKLSSKKQFFKK